MTSLLGRLLRLFPESVPLEDLFTEAVARLFETRPQLCLEWLNATGLLTAPIDDPTQVYTRVSFGLTNGDLFTHLVAFSPGFSSPADRRGKPPVFVSHGTRDEVLPIEDTSRRIVPRLESEGYEVRYQEFDGPHAVPKPVAREALEWFS